VVDHHPDFPAGATQLHWVSKQHSWFVIDQVRAGAGEAIVEQCCEPTWAEMDDHLVRGHIDPLDQGDKDDPHPQRRHLCPLCGEFGGTGHQVLLEHRLAEVSFEDLE
jgi:hypothetical protein